MSDPASRKRNGSRVPGRPIQPGQVLNPNGNNQYTYRREWEREVEKALRVESGDERRTLLQELVEKLLSEARTGKPWAMRLVMKRLWPERSRLEVEDTTPVLNGGAVWQTASARLDEMVKRQEIKMGELPPEMQELYQKLESCAHNPADQEERYNRSLEVVKALLEIEGWQLIPPEAETLE